MKTQLIPHVSNDFGIYCRPDDRWVLTYSAPYGVGDDRFLYVLTIDHSLAGGNDDSFKFERWETGDNVELVDSSEVDELIETYQSHEDATIEEAVSWFWQHYAIVTRRETEIFGQLVQRWNALNMIASFRVS